MATTPDRPDTRPGDQAGASRLTPESPVDLGGVRDSARERSMTERGGGRVAAPAPAPAPEPAPVQQQAQAPTRKEVVRDQRQAFGGIKWGSAFFGWLSAIGLAVPLIALASAAGAAIGLTTSGGAGQAATSAAQNASTIGLTGGIILLVILMLAYYAGGYVAGRMARFDGLRQGVAVWVVGLLIMLALALIGLVAGAQYNVLANLNLPAIPVDSQTMTRAGLISLLAVLVGTLLAAAFGGKLGERYHRKIDRVGLER